MLNKYDVMEKLVVLGGLTGKFMVWMGMLGGCILVWYFVFAFIKAGISFFNSFFSFRTIPITNLGLTLQKRKEFCKTHFLIVSLINDWKKELIIKCFD